MRMIIEPIFLRLFHLTRSAGPVTTMYEVSQRHCVNINRKILTDNACVGGDDR